MVKLYYMGIFIGFCSFGEIWLKKKKICVYSSLGKQVCADSGLVGSPRSVGDQISIDVSLKS